MKKVFLINIKRVTIMEIKLPKNIRIMLRYLSKDKEMFAVFTISVILGLSYLIWRTAYTIDYSMGTANLIWPMTLLLAETYSFVVFAIFAFASVNFRQKLPSLGIKDPNYFPSVDIFICTYNESENILRETINGCKNIEYKNKKIYLLDDGHRENIKKLAQDLGINYIKRETNEGFKAGNINNALKYTGGEIIAIFDADHVPVSTFLLELIDYFKDNNTGIVQTPQHFMNPDPFQKNLVVGKPMSNEQDLFFRVIQPGLAKWNSAICAGTNFLIRREPLLKIGGLPHNTVTEDMDLGLRLKNLGFLIRYHNKPLAVGLAPETFKDYLQQRLRWAAGTIQIFLFNRGLFFKSLTWPQKTFYMSGLFYYFFGFPRLVFIMSPVLYLLWDIRPLSAHLIEVGIFLIVCYLSKIYFFRKVAKNYRNFVFTDVYETAVCFYLDIAVIKTLINPRNIKFNITGKGVDAAKTDFMMFFPQVVLLGFAIASFIVPIHNLYYHIFSLEALALNLFLNLFNTIILIFSIKVALEKPDLRKERRIPMQIDANLEDKNKTNIEMNVLDLSRKGALLFVPSGKKGILEPQSDEAVLTLPDVDTVPLSIVNAYKNDRGKFYNCKFYIDSPIKEEQILKLAFKNSNNW